MTLKMPNIRMSHLGICVEDLVEMENFYTGILGFTVTDRGEVLGMDIVFLSRDPGSHHQVVLTTGRPRNIGRNVLAPDFGAVINQISFELSNLTELKQMYEYLLGKGLTDFMLANHGTAWSIYFDDPEGNKIEIFVDSEWYCAQPIVEPLDLSLPDDVIIARTLELARSGKNFQPIEEWRRNISGKMGLS